MLTKYKEDKKKKKPLLMILRAQIFLLLPLQDEIEKQKRFNIE